MAMAVIVTLEKDLPEAISAYNKTKSGKALARESDRLETAARSRGVASITSMLSESHAVLFEQMREQGFDPSNMRLPPEQWFAAQDGLQAVKAIAEFVESHLKDYKQPNPILKDLKAAEAMLAAADAAGVRFHFTKINQ